MKHLNNILKESILDPDFENTDFVSYTGFDVTRNHQYETGQISTTVFMKEPYYNAADVLNDLLGPACWTPERGVTFFESEEVLKENVEKWFIGNLSRIGKELAKVCKPKVKVFGGDRLGSITINENKINIKCYLGDFIICSFSCVKRVKEPKRSNKYKLDQSRTK